MAKTEGKPVLDSDQEEIALSDSELDDVLKSADVTNESIDAEDGNLEQYGVWVKVEPQNLEEEAEQNMSFELSDIDSSGEPALTDEEEQLLGELEEDEDADIGDLSGLEDDLEELGKGSAFEEQGVEEELSVEDLDVDLDALGNESLEDSGELEGLAEMEGEESFSLETEPDMEIEVPLSDSAIVEEHYEDLATVEGVPSTPGQTPSKGSSDILEKIEHDLNQIKTEIQSLKNELAGLGKGSSAAGKVDVAPAPSGDDEFFERGEDETIALTGDELDNILNTADVTEEVELPEESLESLEVEELPEQDVVELTEEAEAPAEAGDEIMELGSLDLEAEPGPSEEISLDDTELSLEELEPSETDEQAIEIDIGGGSLEEELSLDEAGIDEVEAPEELTLEEPAEEPIEELELEELDELSLEDSVGEESEALEELSLEEPEEVLPGEEPGEALSAEEPAEDLELEELDELSLEESGGEESEPLEELSLDEPGIEESESPEEVSFPEAVSEASSRQPDTEGLSEDLKSEIKSILTYFNQLLVDLPEAKITEFAQSEYFVRYQRLFEELGLEV